MAITGGQVEFLERVTTGQYQHKEARVIVQFDSPADIDAARNMALQQVRLALAASPAGVIVVPKLEEAHANLAKSWDMPKLEDSVKKAIAEIVDNPGAPVVFPESDDIPLLVTDADLIAACKAKQAKGTDPALIRGLITRYVGAGKSCIHIKQDLRWEFLRDLGVLRVEHA